MAFVYAFLVGGVICGLFQLVMMITKLHPPEMLVIGFMLGGVLLTTGVIAWLESVGGAGMSIMVMDAGGATAAGLLALLHGDPSILILFVGILIIVVALGIIAGAIRDARGVDKVVEAESAV